MPLDLPPTPAPTTSIVAPAAAPATLSGLTAAQARVLSAELTKRLADPAQKIADVATFAYTQLGDFSSASAQLKAGQSQPGDGPDSQLRNLIGGLADDLAFVPTREAPVPPGWPADAPVGVVVVQQYPTYRVAITTPPQPVLKSSAMFFTLFGHITKRSIPMTAPVEMGYDSKAGLIEPASMGFLYPDTTTGQAGPVPNERVTIKDVPAMTVLSIAHTGRFSGDRTVASRKLLEAWLAQHPEYKAAGDVRVLGWNGPGTIESRCYTQVQIPITSSK